MRLRIELDAAEHGKHEDNLPPTIQFQVMVNGKPVLATAELHFYGGSYQETPGYDSGWSGYSLYEVGKLFV